MMVLFAEDQLGQYEMAGCTQFWYSIVTVTTTVVLRSPALYMVPVQNPNVFFVELDSMKAADAFHQESIEIRFAGEVSHLTCDGQVEVLVP